MIPEDRKDFLSWMVWRLSDPEVELMESKLEKKKRLKSRKGAKRQTGATGEKINVCKFCTKSFAKKTHLTVHERVHTGEKPYVCTVCDASFAQSTGLKTHKLKHIQGDTPFQCPHCNKKVTTKGNLKLHMKLHSGEKPFYCNQCDRSFPRKSALTRHLFIHSGDRPFNCQYCTKTFRRKTDLETHERIHTGVKPYVCKYCAKAFSDQRNWKAHEKKHTGSMNCSTCGKGPFQRNSDLRAHIAQNHGVDSQLNSQITPQINTQITSQLAQVMQPQQQQQQHELQTVLGTVSNTTAVNVITLPTADSKHAQINGNPVQQAGTAIVGYNCRYCGKVFHEYQQLTAHLTTDHLDTIVSSASNPQSQLEAPTSQQIQYDSLQQQQQQQPQPPQQQQQFNVASIGPSLVQQVQTYN